MYAVIATGGKQYKVTKGEILRVEKLDGDERCPLVAIDEGVITGDPVTQGGEKALVTLWCALVLVFASRKYTQAVKDDIGDKSVFIFADMSEPERDASVAASTASLGFN